MVKTILNVKTHGPAGEEAWVFLHGFMGCRRSFDSVVALLSQTCHCISFDLPGHGKSLFRTTDSFTTLSTIEDVASLILRDLEAMNIVRFSLYGYSMGGRVAQNMAVLAPQRVERLILESASFGIADHEERRQRYLRDQNLLSAVQSKAGFEKFLSDWYNLPLFASLRGTACREQMIREKADNDVSELQKALKIMSVGAHPYLMPFLADLPAELIYFCGEKDEAYRSAAIEAVKYLQRLQVTVFPGASHNIHCQFPKAIADRLNGIMAGGRENES